MNCSVCNKNPAVAKCSICGAVICKTCGVLCPSCKKPICRSHLVRLADGKIACRSCAVPKQTVAVPKTAPPSATSKPANAAMKQEEKVSLSFEDLSTELGDISIKIPGSSESVASKEPVVNRDFTSAKNNAPTQEAAENPFALSAKPEEKAEPSTGGYKHLKRKPSDDPNEFRILTASSPKATPMWVSGLISALLALILSIPLLKNSQSPFFPSLFSYSVILLAGGSAFWNGYGLFWSGDSSLNRILCIPGIIFSIIAIGIGIFFGLR